MTETAEAPAPTGPTHPRLAGARATTVAITVGLCAIIAGLCIAFVTSLPAVHTADAFGVRALGHARSPALTSLIIPTLHIPFTVAWAVPLSAILGSVAAWRSRSWRPFAFLALSVAVSAAISHLAKAVVERPRPTLTHHLVNETTLSFPSGHATCAAALLLSIAVLVSRAANASDRSGVGGGARRARAVTVIAWVVAISGAILVGVSRVYFGVHWPTDVLAGWLIGAGTVMVFCPLIGVGAVVFHHAPMPAEGDPHDPRR
ncbi:MAG: phosphatase PAP2 family protein [Dermabacter sp.]|nr:phosphatase PAP2 family protein [Dermabacter sp.]